MCNFTETNTYRLFKNTGITLQIRSIFQKNRSLGVIQAPNLAWLMPKTYVFIKSQPSGKKQDGGHFSRWPPFRMWKLLFFYVNLNVSTVATVKCCMEKVRGTTAYLSPDQVPDNTVDQTIYALAKQVQWQWPEQFRMDKFVTMFGRLYIEVLRHFAKRQVLWERLVWLYLGQLSLFFLPQTLQEPACYMPLCQPDHRIQPCIYFTLQGRLCYIIQTKSVMEARFF